MTQPTRTARAAVAMALLCTALLGAARAQYGSGYGASSLYGPNPGISLTMMHQMSERNIYRNMMQATAAKTAAPALAVAAPAVAPRPLSATDFVPTGARKVAEEIAASVADLAGRAQLIQVCRQIFSTLEATPGFRKNNLASAITLLLAVSQQVLSGQEFDDAQSQALMRLVNDDIVASGVVASWSGAQRTHAYDAMVITGGLIAGIARNGAGEPAADFRAEWADLSQGRGTAGPAPAARSSAAASGSSRLEASRDEQTPGSGRYKARQVTFSGHGRRTSAPAIYNDAVRCQDQVEAFVASLTPLAPTGAAR